MSKSRGFQTTQQMILEIERKDRRFRIAQTVFMLLVMAAMVGALIFLIQLLDRMEEQLDKQKQTIQSLEQNSKKQTQHLQCVAEFFTKSGEEREDSRIKTIDDCVLVDNKKRLQSNNETGGQDPTADSNENLTSGPAQTGPSQNENTSGNDTARDNRPGFVTRMLQRLRGIINL